MNSTCKYCDETKDIKLFRTKNQCKECRKIYIKEHYQQNKEKIKQKSKEYTLNKRHFCIHKKVKTNCKICTCKFKVTIKNWISTSRSHDKKRNIFDKDNYIDKSFLENLVEEYRKKSFKCFYCDVTMVFDIADYDTQCTIERIDNYFGHTKSNCILCCFKCNVKKVGNIKI